jgi:hypothetical protein
VGDHFEVVVPGFHRPETTPFGTRMNDLTAWVRREPDPDSYPLAPEATVRDHYRELLAAPGGVAFAYTQCGSLEVLSQDGSNWRVRQRHGPFSLEGWVRGPLTSRGNHRCSPRYRLFDDPEVSSEWRRREVDQTPSLPPKLYWLVDDGARLACQELVVRRNELRHRTTSGEARVEHVYTIEREGYDWIVYGPATTVRSRRGIDSEAAVGCAERYRVVEVGDAWRLLVGGANDPFEMYHPDDTETWFLTLEACRSAREAPNPSRYVHAGC